jgi:PIN domain nuclease of toxin-antitoxin system
VRILADTHVLLWWLADHGPLPGAIKEAIADARSTVYFSAISVAETAIKASLGKLDAPDDFATVLTQEGFRALPFTPDHAEQLRHLPWHHRDPFDRMLVAQAMAEGLTLATVDLRLRAYDVSVLGI